MYKKMNEMQIKRLLKFLSEGLSDREIAKKLGISHPAVASYRRKSEESGESYEKLMSGDYYLPDFFKKDAGHRLVDEKKYKALEPLLPVYARQMNSKYGRYDLCFNDYKKHVPVSLLYGYTAFKNYVKRYKECHNLSYHLDHVPGDEMQVDFAGDTIPIIDRKTGEISNAHLLVCILPASQLTYAAPMLNMSVPFVYNAMADALIYFGGTPKRIISDNMKQYVTRADRYEPTFNDGAVQFSEYYNIDLEGCRVRAPKDKAYSENAVQKLYGAIHDRIFTGDGSGIPIEINNELQLKNLVMGYIEDYNSKIQRLDGLSRWQRFELIEKDKMGPLHQNKFHIWHEKKIQRLGSDYHILVGEEKHHYSVPYTYVGQELVVRYNAECVVVYNNKGNKVCTHVRKMMSGWSTLEDHMPERHKAFKEISERNAAFYIRSCHMKSTDIGEWIESLLNNAQRPEHYYRQCEGVLSMIKREGVEPVKQACIMLNNLGIYKYVALRDEVKHLIKKEAEVSAQDTSASQSLPIDDDVRGPENYK